MNGSSQSKVVVWLSGEVKTPPFSASAQIEAGDSSVSLDLMVRTFLAMGATREDLALALAQQNEVIASSQS
jgi:hypothetical protein